MDKLKELPFDARELLEKVSQKNQNLDKNVALLLLTRHLKLVYNVGLEIYLDKDIDKLY